MIYKLKTNLLNNLVQHVKFSVSKCSIHHTHYEILNLSNNCSSKEIKDAFIRLSKKYHPDISKNAASQTKFVRIVEAYNVLSKAESRRSYDLGFASPVSNGPIYYNNSGSAKSPWDDPTLYENRDKSNDSYYEKQPYYGIKGVKKVSNKMIVAICILIAAFGVGLQVIAITNSLTFNRKQLLEVSNSAEQNLAKSRREAEINGNELQIDLLKQKMRHNGSTE